MKETTCGCCAGIENITPEITANRPGLPALTYRIGTHATFLETMLASLSSQPGLTGLTTREISEPVIALLDAGATLLDVLTFYQERIANEGFLRTATERRSILELARLVGYKLRPGVASSVYLAFTLENNFKPGDLPTAPNTARRFDPEKSYRTEIPAGTRAQSIPHPGELPQAFETSEPLLARTEWNTLQPRISKPLYIHQGNAVDLTHLYFKGTSTNLKPNDPLLLVLKTDPNAQVLHWVNKVETKVLEDTTTITLQSATVETEAVALKVLLELVTRYLQLEAFPVSATTQMAQRVIGFLTQFQQQLVPGTSTAKLGFLIKHLLLDLHKEHAIAIEGEYGRLEPWLGRMIQELEAFETALDQGVVPGTGFQFGSDGKNRGTNTSLAGLNAVLPTLALPPSIQPENAQNLGRNYTSVFNPQADTLPRLITAFHPNFKGTLYTAWANTKVTEAAELQSANALRVKAAPFGHNAPLRVIQDEEGVIVGQEEWPLISARRIDLSLSVNFSSGGVESFSQINQAQITYFLNGRLNKKLIPFQLGTFLVGDLVIRITANESDQKVLEFEDFSSKNLLQKVVLVHDNLSLKIIFNDQDEISLTLGDFAKTILSSSHRVTITTKNPQESDGFKGELIAIRDEFPPERPNILTLDAEYNQITPQSWVAVQRGDESEPRIFQVNEVKTVSLAAYGLSGKVTELTLSGEWLNISGEQTDWSAEILRKTTIYAQSERLELAEEPITDPIAEDKIELGALYDGLESGRWIIVSGERADFPSTTGVKASELVMVAGVTQGVAQLSQGEGELIDLPGDQTHTFLTLANALAYTYKRDTVKIYGNVVKATHGETRQEVLGSGNAGKSFQHFNLKHFPLTYVSAATPTGLETTLEVRVNDVLWPEADSLLWLDGRERGYETQTDDNAKTSVIFGNGKHGARLPTGVENVKATYRSGIGKVGNVAAEQISMLATKPLGVKEVINPLPATGGADQETRDQARRNVPLAGMALDRLVSVQDYADFARTFAGIGKATARELSDGRQRVVHVTAAGAEDIPIAKTSDLFLHLHQAFQTQHGDPFQPVMLDVRKLKVLVIVAKVRLQPAYAWEFVEPDIRGALLETFSFERRELEQDVTNSEVITTIQAVEGVAYVDLEILDAVDEDIPLPELETLAQTLTLRDRIRTYPARPDTGTFPYTLLPAQIAYLTPEIPDTLILSELTA
ncbi:MAG: hypothetical protein Fur0022_08960 [Anaerolineales bacterium]